MKRIGCLGVVALFALTLQAQDLATVEKANQYIKACALQNYATSADSLYTYAKGVADGALDAEGNIKDFTKGQLESLALGNLMNTLYTHTQEEKYKKASNWLHQYLVVTSPRNKKTTAQNLFTYQENQPYRYRLDGLYWAGSFYAAWLGTFDSKNTSGWSDMAEQFTLLNTQTKNAITGLNYSEWISDLDKDENSEGAITEGVFKGCIPTYNAMSMAHFFCAVIDALQYIPKEQPDRAVLIKLATQVAEGLMSWQDEATSQWSTTLVPSENAQPDETATQLIAGSYLKGLRLGVLKDATYKAFAQKTYNAAKLRGATALLAAEYTAWQKATTATKKPAARTAVRRTTTRK